MVRWTASVRTRLVFVFSALLPLSVTAAPESPFLYGVWAKMTHLNAITQAGQPYVRFTHADFFCVVTV